MADLFAPKLQSSIAFEQPVSQPQVGSALANLSSVFLGGSRRSAPAPTSEEKFGAAWTNYTKRLKDQGVVDKDAAFTAGTASLSQLRQFGALYPQFSDDVFSRAKTENNVQLQQIEAEQSGQNTIISEFFSSGEGAVVAAQANQFRAQGDNEKADKIEADGLAGFLTRKAEMSRISDAAKKTQDLTTLSNDVWSVNKKAVRSQADIAANGLTQLLVAFKADPTGSFSLEERGLGSILQAFPNISTKVINKDNFGEFALQLKSEIMRTQKLRVEGEAGFELREVPSGYEAEVFKGFDAIVEWAKKDLDPAEIVKRAKNEGFIRMQESGIPVGDLAAIELISSDPTIQASIIGGFTEDIQKYIGAIKEGSTARIGALKNISTDSMKEARNHFARMVDIYSGNSTDAKPYPEASLDQLTMGIRDNMLGLIESHSQIDDRTGTPQRFKKEAWDQYFAKNASAIINIAAQDSDFATTIGTALANDLMIDVKKIQEITKDKGITISFDKAGQIQFDLNEAEMIEKGLILSKAEAADLQKKANNGDMLAKQRLSDYATEGNVDKSAYLAQTIGPEAFRKTSVNLDDLNYKWNILSQLGQVGNSVKSTINQELTPVAVAQPQATTINQKDLPNYATVKETNGVQVAVNKGMNPLIGSMDGASTMTKPSADKNLDAVLAGPFQDLQSRFGKTIVINDAIAKAGTSRETETKGSRHFHGDALDIDISKYSNEEKIRLVEAALAAGFQGFGFGNGILHIDMGAKRVWNYEISKFAGVAIDDMYAMVYGSKAPRPDLSIVTSPDANPATQEADPDEKPATGFKLLEDVVSGVLSINPAVPRTMTNEVQQAVSAEEILPSQPQTSQRLGEKGGLPRVVDTPVFDKDVMDFLNALRVDPEGVFSVKDEETLQAAEANGLVKKGDQVLIGEGQDAYLVEID